MLQPTNDFVLLEEEPYSPYHEYKQYHHVIVPEKYTHGPEDRAVIGIVRGKGSHCHNTAITLHSRVVIGKWTGARFLQDGKMVILVKEDDILAVVT